MKKNRTILLVLTICFILINNKSFSQKGEETRAMWIFNIAAGVTWENQGSLSKYTIGVFSSKEEFDAINKLVKTRTINRKHVEVIQYLNYKDIKPNSIVYVTKNENANLGFIYQKLKGKNVLIISDRSKQTQYSVINLNKTTSKQPFTINSDLCKEQKLKMSMALLRLGGDRFELKKIQAETNKKLLNEKERLSEMQRDIEFKDKEIEILKEKLRKFEKKIKQNNIC